MRYDKQKSRSVEEGWGRRASVGGEMTIDHDWRLINLNKDSPPCRDIPSGVLSLQQFFLYPPGIVFLSGFIIPSPSEFNYTSATEKVSAHVGFYTKNGYLHPLIPPPTTELKIR